MQKYRPPLSGPAFTLVELLVVIAVIGILAAFAIPAFSSAQVSASRGKSAGNLKNFGAAMYSFVADNNGMLPGPANGNTLSRISPHANSGSANGLEVQLMTYLERERPSGNSWRTFFMKSLAYPAWQSLNRGTNDNGIPSYLACQSYPMPDGTVLSPFGAQGGVKPMSVTALQSKLAQFSPAQSKPYAAVELDQLLFTTGVTWASPGWKSRLSTNALHGKVRNALYFDGSVSAVPVDRKPLPW